MSLDNSLLERILIYGNAGCGKTDLMTELAWKDSPYKLRFLAVDPNCPIGVRAGILRRNLDLAPGQIATCSILDQAKSNTFKGGGGALFGKARSTNKDAAVIENLIRVIDGDFIATDMADMSTVNYGNMGDWGRDTILVVDSMSLLLNEIAKSAKVDLEAESKSGVANGLAVVGRQQEYLYNFLSHVACKLRCHVVVLAHCRVVDTDTGGKIILPRFPGEARNEEFLGLFSNFIYQRMTGKGAAKKPVWNFSKDNAKITQRSVPAKYLEMGDVPASFLLDGCTFFE